MPIRLFLALFLLAGAAWAGTLEDVRRDGVLRACIWPEYFGISHRNVRTGALQGLDVDMSRAFATELGVQVEHVETTFAAFAGDLASGRCHIAMMGVAITPQRAERVDFSRPYLRSDIYAVAARSNAAVRRWGDIDQPGRVVSVQQGTVMETAMRERLRHAELKVVSRPLDRERDVQAGRADVFLADFPYSQAILQNADWARVIEPAQPVRLSDYAYAVRKGEAAWLERVNHFVARAKRDGTLESLARQHGLLPIVVRD